MMDEKQPFQVDRDAHNRASRQRNGSRRWSLAILLGCLIATSFLVSRFPGLDLTAGSNMILPAATVDDKSFQLYRHLGHRSPFFVPPNTPKSLKSGEPPGCSISKAFLIHRHGSRYPHAEELDVIQDLSSYISNNSALFANPRAKLPGAWSFLVRGWAANFRVDDLTAPGRKQLFDRGVALRLHHPELYTEADVLAADEDRVIESARWFMDGYYGRDGNATADLRIVGENNETVSWITPHKTCERWSDDVADDAVARWQAVYLPPIAKRVNAVLAGAYPGVRFTAAHVQAMLFDCAYGTSARGIGSSPWCGVFRRAEILDSEYESDLRMRGFSGYGLPGDMGAVLGSMLVGNVTDFLRRDEDDTEKFSFNFGHDKTIALGLTALGLAADKSYPPAGPVDPHRSWRAGRQMPFGGYMLFKRLECGGKEKIRIQLTVNGASFDVGPTGCRSDKYGSCALEDFLSSNRVQAAINVKHGDERWKQACSPDEEEN
ncbi:phosphoglycerate mutase-like protein [Hypoxylon sp. FL1284]|nr:phosphoglycerate mutase-like protein [Hypoxylon sp. FL1284]